VQKEYGRANAVEATPSYGTTSRWKDQARLLDKEWDEPNNRLGYIAYSEPVSILPQQTAQNFTPPIAGMAAPFSPGPLLPPFPVISMPPPLRFMGMGPMPSPPTRATCEAGLSPEAGLAASLTSRLRLNSDQIKTWRKVEDAAQPALEKLHSVCDRLPVESTTTTTMLDAMDILDAEMAARLELIRATRNPLRELYEMLTPEQRAELRPPLPPI
jgi:hypothetical protein